MCQCKNDASGLAIKKVKVIDCTVYRNLQLNGKLNTQFRIRGDM